VSVLTETLAASLQILVGSSLQLQTENGLFELIFLKIPDRSAELLVAATILGLRSLEKQYPDRLDITVRS
jgi:uncharacterized protein YsxB (DUF464 family)